MLRFILGVAIGVVGMMAKEKILGDANSKKQQREKEELYNENEKLCKCNKELERQVEDLQSENAKIRRRYMEKDDMRDDFAEELRSAKSDIKKLRMYNDDLSRKLQDYKIAIESKEAEISMLKDRL